MKKKLPTILFAAVFLAGLCILAYPFITSFISNINQAAVVSDYSNKVNDVDAEKRQEMLNQAERYNKSIFGRVTLTDPFDAANAENQTEEFDYNKLLSVDDNGTMGYITIPAIDVNLPIYHGTDDTTLQVGVGHLLNTSLPVGGTSTHSVLAGHTGLPNSTLFTNLTDLVEGDTFYIHVLGEVHEYKINKIEVVLPSDTSDLGIVQGKDYITLVTCTPYGINTHRLLVRGERTDYNSDDDHYQQTIQGRNDGFYFCGVFISYIALTLIVGGIIVVVIGIIVIKKLRKKHNNENQHKEE